MSSYSPRSYKNFNLVAQHAPTTLEYIQTSKKNQLMINNTNDTTDYDMEKSSSNSAVIKKNKEQTNVIIDQKSKSLEKSVNENVSKRIEFALSEESKYKSLNEHNTVPSLKSRSLEMYKNSPVIKMNHRPKILIRKITEDSNLTAEMRRTRRQRVYPLYSRKENVNQSDCPIPHFVNADKFHSTYVYSLPSIKKYDFSTLLPTTQIRSFKSFEEIPRSEYLKDPKFEKIKIYLMNKYTDSKLIEILILYMLNYGTEKKNDEFYPSRMDKKEEREFFYGLEVRKMDNVCYMSLKKKTDDKINHKKAVFIVQKNGSENNHRRGKDLMPVSQTKNQTQEAVGSTVNSVMETKQPPVESLKKVYEQERNCVAENLAKNYSIIVPVDQNNCKEEIIKQKEKENNIDIASPSIEIEKENTDEVNTERESEEEEEEENDCKIENAFYPQSYSSLAMPAIPQLPNQINPMFFNNPYFYPNVVSKIQKTCQSKKKRIRVRGNNNKSNLGSRQINQDYNTHPFMGMFNPFMYYNVNPLAYPNLFLKMNPDQMDNKKIKNLDINHKNKSGCKIKKDEKNLAPFNASTENNDVENIDSDSLLLKKRQRDEKEKGLKKSEYDEKVVTNQKSTLNAQTSLIIKDSKKDDDDIFKRLTNEMNRKSNTEIYEDMENFFADNNNIGNLITNCFDENDNITSRNFLNNFDLSAGNQIEIPLKSQINREIKTSPVKLDKAYPTNVSSLCPNYQLDVKVVDEWTALEMLNTALRSNNIKEELRQLKEKVCIPESSITHLEQAFVNKKMEGVPKEIYLFSVETVKYFLKFKHEIGSWIFTKHRLKNNLNSVPLI